MMTLTTLITQNIWNGSFKWILYTTFRIWNKTYRLVGRIVHNIAYLPPQLRIRKLDMEVAYHEANFHYINEEYDKAISLYTTAIGLHPNHSHLQSLQNRAAAYLKLHRYYECLDVRF